MDAVSIHARTGRATCRVGEVSLNPSGFNSRAHGARDMGGAVGSFGSGGAFQFTRARGARQVGGGSKENRLEVSIHARTGRATSSCNGDR